MLPAQQEILPQMNDEQGGHKRAPATSSSGLPMHTQAQHTNIHEYIKIISKNEYFNL